MAQDTALAPGAQGAQDALSPAGPDDDPFPPARRRPAGRPASRGRERGRPTTEPLRRPEALGPRQRITRAVFLVVLTLLVPGTAQLAAGDRRLGRLVVRVWLGVAGLVVLTALLWLLDRTIVLTLATSPLLLMLLAAGLFVTGLAWPLLVLDAWRLGRPILLPRRARLAMTALLVVALALTSVPVLGAARRVWAASTLLEGVFGGGAAAAAVQGRYNVLLMGGDAGPDRVGTRPDSLTLASIDATTGRTVLFSLPRNLENVHFPEGSSGAAALPQGWTCGDECLLNGIYTWGSEHADAFPGARDPGAEAMKQAVEGVTGLPVNYYVLVDLRGFQSLIDAMGGVEVTVTGRVPIGGGTSKVSGYIEPGTQQLDGYHALWFARSRHGASDYARMARQRCVMDAMVQQMDPATLLARFQGIAAAAQQVMSTDIPTSALPGFIDLGARAKSQRITSVAFVPPLIQPAYPDFGLIQGRVIDALIASRAEPDPSVSASAPAGRGAASGAAGAAPAVTPAAGEVSASAAAVAAGPGAVAPSNAPAGPEDVTATCRPA